MPEIKLNHATLDYRDEGSGPAVVLIHGLLVNRSLWDGVLPGLAPHCRCIVPDLPLGAHRRPAGNDADLSPPGVAALIAELIERLELGQVTLVGNDTGGALCQLVAAERPELLARLVLTNCDSFEHFPPPTFKPLMKALGHVPGATLVLADAMRLRTVRRIGFRPLAIDPIPDDVLREWTRPLRIRGVRRDLMAFARGMVPEHTLQAAERLRNFDRPALLVWGVRDAFFPLVDAQRLADLLPAARLEQIEQARTFVPIDAPQRLAELVRAFVHGPAVEAYEEV